MDETNAIIQVEAIPVKPKRNRGNPAWGNRALGIPTQSGNPGGGVTGEFKPVRKTLTEIWDMPADESFVPKTKGQKIAWAYFQQVEETKAGTPERAEALERLATRIDGKDVSQKLEVASISPNATTSNLVLVGVKK